MAKKYVQGGGRRCLMDRASATKRMDWGVRGSNPAAAAYRDLFFGPNFSGGISLIATTYIEQTFWEASA